MLPFGRVYASVSCSGLVLFSAWICGSGSLLWVTTASRYWWPKLVASLCWLAVMLRAAGCLGVCSWLSWCVCSLVCSWLSSYVQLVVQMCAAGCPGVFSLMRSWLSRCVQLVVQVCADGCPAMCSWLSRCVQLVSRYVQPVVQVCAAWCSGVCSLVFWYVQFSPASNGIVFSLNWQQLTSIVCH